MAGNREQRRRDQRRNRQAPDPIRSFSARLTGAGTEALQIPQVRDRIRAGVRSKADSQAWANAESLAAQLGAEAASEIGVGLAEWTHRRLAPAATATGIELGDAAGHAVWLGYVALLESVAEELVREAQEIRDALREPDPR